MSTLAANQSPDSLLRAFSAADYRVSVGGRGFRLRPGLRHPDLDAAIERHEWAVVTACNPGGVLDEEEDNRRRHKRLLETVGERCWAAHSGTNSDPSGTWPDEPSLLLVGVPLAALDALAADFGQAAVLAGRRGEPARLRLYGRDWQRNLPDWVERAE